MYESEGSQSCGSSTWIRIASRDETYGITSEVQMLPEDAWWEMSFGGDVT